MFAPDRAHLRGARGHRGDHQGLRGIDDQQHSSRRSTDRSGAEPADLRRCARNPKPRASDGQLSDDVVIPRPVDSMLNDRAEGALIKLDRGRSIVHPQLRLDVDAYLAQTHSMGNVRLV